MLKPELALGGRLGSITTTTASDTSTKLGAGPVASIGVEESVNPHFALRAAIEGGYGFGRSRTAWATFTDALSVRW